MSVGVSVLEIHGTVKEGFEGVREAFAKNFTKGFEVGASVSVIHHGEVVVDIWGGHTDPERTEAWQRDNIVNVWSTTKTMMFLIMLMLHDSGELSVHDPVTKCWPEFAANGKESIEIRHLMSHTSGLAGWTETMSPQDLFDHAKCAAALAAQAPWWEPGTQSGYHAMSQGYLLGEVVRRVTGQTLGQFFRQNIAEPLAADFHIGTGSEHDHRVALCIPAQDAVAPNPDNTSVAARCYGNPLMDARASWKTEWRRCESPAANGHGNARSVALVQSILSHGGSMHGKTFLSPQTCEKVFEIQASGKDLVLGTPIVLGLGYGLKSRHSVVSPNERACFWGGWGGSLVVNDLDASMTYAYVMNKMSDTTTGDSRAGRALLATFQAIAN